MKSIATSYHLKPVGVAVGILILALASASLVLGGVQAQESPQPSEYSVGYAENGDGSVLTLTATDPEGVTPHRLVAAGE